MAKDVFQREVAFGGAFPADFVKLAFGPLQNGVGAVVQRVALAYQQAVARLFELGSPQFYYVGGRAQGEATLDKVLGPSDVMETIISTYGDICNPQDFQMWLRGGCPNPQSVNIACGGCVATSFGVNAAANDAIINESVRMMLGWVNYVSGAGA